jgi:hypothetical protein
MPVTETAVMMFANLRIFVSSDRDGHLAVFAANGPHRRLAALTVRKTPKFSQAQDLNGDV